MHCEAAFRHDVPPWLLRLTFLTHHKPKHSHPEDWVKTVDATQQTAGLTNALNTFVYLRMSFNEIVLDK
jgi:hypothetical protein